MVLPDITLLMSCWHAATASLLAGASTFAGSALAATVPLSQRASNTPGIAFIFAMISAFSASLLSPDKMITRFSCGLRSNDAVTPAMALEASASFALPSKPSTNFVPPSMALCDPHASNAVSAAPIRILLPASILYLPTPNIHDSGQQHV